MQSTLVRCPLCGQVDAVQKVSAIIAGNQLYQLYTKDGIKSLSNESLTHAMPASPYQTTLSERLAFPEHRYGCSTLLLITFGAILAPGTSIVAWFTYNAAASNPSPSNQMAMFMNVILALLCIGIALVCSLLRSRQKSVDKPRRERAMAIWNTLYYCHRNDIVFVADNPLQRTDSKTMRVLINY
ncbi:hypothetical protein [Dictyobacter kobayashii]|uniref:Uncharacterized protein n=1 Tax=Dictyobacter kobayashii TaxID=2014872 RepID=A0A402AQG6_9CHLR|nr:hypothetical protein [Dictyobacter kobayashii]GCE21403.1 hypothetical protein KDK_52030 [Dictyobacter kobayashii]